jgi:hypothetical protein
MMEFTASLTKKCLPDRQPTDFGVGGVLNEIGGYVVKRYLIKRGEGRGG